MATGSASFVSLPILSKGSENASSSNPKRGETRIPTPPASATSPTSAIVGLAAEASTAIRPAPLKPMRAAAGVHR